MRRKRTISERVTENGDPLVARKKARDAGKKVSVAKKVAQVRLHLKKSSHLLIANF
jgi:hypothetical protein